MVYFFFYPVIFLLLRTVIVLFGRVRTTGAHNVPQTGPVIYCPNHLSDADPPTIFVTAPRRAWYIGKEELFEPPFWGWFFREFRGIPIRRDSADRAALRVAEGKLKAGDPLVIFPEGRCSQDGKLQKIQPGAALISLRTGAPIVPVGIRYTNAMMPYGKMTPRFSPVPVLVDYGTPIFPSDYRKMKQSEAVGAMTHRLGVELARLTGQSAPAPECKGTKPRREARSRAKTDDDTIVATENNDEISQVVDKV